MGDDKKALLCLDSTLEAQFQLCHLLCFPEQCLSNSKKGFFLLIANITFMKMRSLCFQLSFYFSTPCFIAFHPCDSLDTAPALFFQPTDNLKTHGDLSMGIACSSTMVVKEAKDLCFKRYLKLSLFSLYFNSLLVQHLLQHHALNITENLIKQAKSMSQSRYFHKNGTINISLK